MHTSSYTFSRGSDNISCGDFTHGGLPFVCESFEHLFWYSENYNWCYGRINNREIIHTEYLYFRYPQLSEGDLTKIRSALSCESALAAVARQLSLGDYLLIGNGEKECHGNCRESTLCDLFEAVLGAIYLSAGLDKAKAFVLNTMESNFPDPKKLLNSLNPKGQLQEFAQGRWKKVPEYRLLRHGGPQHCPFFEVEVRVERFVAIGSGSSRKQAEVTAAEKMWNYLDARFEGKNK